MHNLYKNKDIFICRHDVHKNFSSRMSVFHVLEKKQCYPNGCVYFKWKCRVLAKKRNCHRNFKQVGKKCFSCKYFYEEKIHQFPEITIDQNNILEFNNQYSEFCDWINTIENKKVFCEAIVHSVLPDFQIYLNNKEYKIGIKGFLITFREGFIDDKHFEDSFFLHIDSNVQNKFRFREEDEIEFKAFVKIIDGKIELFSPRHFNFYLRGDSKPLLKSDLLVSLSTATTLKTPIKKCKCCKYSILPKVENAKIGKKRILICTQGIKNPENCPINDMYNSPKLEQCDNDKCKEPHCNFTL